MGMRGADSCSVKVDELFVPEYRVQSMAAALPGQLFKSASANSTSGPATIMKRASCSLHGVSASRTVANLFAAIASAAAAVA